MSNEGDTSEYLSDLSEKDKPWDKHRGFADRVRDIYKGTDYDKYADRIDSCSNLLEFALTSSDLNEVAFRLRSTHFCRVRHCPVCQWRKSMKWQAKFFAALPKIQAEYPSHRWIFLTLTVRNCLMSELRTVISDMGKGFKRLSELKLFPAAGWIKSIEVTRNSETNEAHPHIHIMMLVPASYFGKSYIKQEVWRSLWQKSMRLDYLPVVHVKAIKAKSKSVDDVAIAAVETLKYTVKESDLVADPDWLIELTTQLHGSKSVAIGGCLKKFMKDESDSDDLINIEEKEEAESEKEEISLYFGWKERIKKYARTK